MIGISNAEAIRTMRALAEHGSIAGTARALGMTRSAVKGRLQRAKERGLTKDSPVVEEASPEATPEPAVDARVVRLQDENTRLRNELKTITRENVDAEGLREALFGLAATTPAPPEWLTDIKTAQGITGVPSSIWSDWHLGEVVTKAEVNGVNEFNLTVAERRIRNLVERTLDLCFSHMTNPKYPGFVVNLIGDIVSGTIHPELEETNEEELFPVIVWAVERLAWALRTLADHFGQVFVACAPGNHGRTTKKPQSKRYIYKNADWLIYTLLDHHFHPQCPVTGEKMPGWDGRIQFSIPETGECLYSVYGHRYMAVHGDDLGVRGGDGIIGAIGPIMRGEIKMRTSQAQIGRDYDTLVMGHWHQALWLPRAHVNNALKGYDEFARRVLRAVATPASQLLWFTHPKRGITARWEITLDERKTSALPWVSWEERNAA